MRKILKTLVLLGIGVVFIITFVWLWSKSKPKETYYEIVEAEQGTIENTSVATGEVAPRDEVLIKPQIPGIISSVLKEAGDFVQEGDVIA
ncbi:MAG: biotin/lipoyl-binding protein, partial [Bacteroidales bacterium]|nr:biotin/lipoyl-binding protein [Bacteroidales bacterium]